ncbi:MAG TPA: TonB-dependent receptor, partial [Sphingomicrobium sp.]|nr:TonB-dependent receptor [Sphingomicrobium sp.]
MTKFAVRRAMLASICLAAIAVPGQALAQDAAPDAAQVPTEEGVPPADVQTEDTAAQGSDQDIVVTARRRNEVLQDVPIAVTAYSGEQLERQGALDITDISDTTPNVNLETSRGTNTTLTAFIRGVGQQDPVAGFEQGVGLYLDDVYLNRPQGALLDIYDVERIEVLRGPQGTLYGRNTIGGAVKYVTRRLADVPEGSVRVNLGTYKQFDVVMSASTPIAGGLKVGAAIARLSRDGFGKNLTTGEENYNKSILAGRGTIEFEPSDAIFFRLSGDYTYDDSDPRGGHRLITSLRSGAPVLDDEFDSRGALFDPTQKVKGGGVSGFAEIGVADWLKLRSITAWRKDTTHSPIDFDALPAVDVDVPAIYRNKQFSQEVQAVVDKGPLAGVIGAYYLDANAFNVFDVRLYTTLPALLPGFTAATRGNVDTKTWAVFGDFTYDITEQFAVSAGLRYTSDKRHAQVFRQNLILGGSPELGGSPPFDMTGTPFPTPAGSVTSNFDGKRKDTAWTPRFSLSYKPNEDHNLYISYSRGFKGGGFDPRGQSTQAPSQSPEDVFDFMAFDPETVDSYELGWKASLLDRRIQLATALFKADYKDVQVPGSAGCFVGGVQTFCGITTNAGSATFKGAEFEGTARLAQDFAGVGSRVNLAATVGYLDAQYDEFVTNVAAFDENGNPDPTSPAQPIDVANFRKIQNTPKWTLSSSLDVSAPVGGGFLSANATISYRSKTHQFEAPSPFLDQKGFALLDANVIYRFGADDRFTIGLHGKNLTDKRYITSGYQFLNVNPVTAQPILSATPFLPGGVPNPNFAVPGIAPSLGTEGVVTA